MDEKNFYILPLKYPPINGCIDKAHFFSIIFGNEKCIPWILNNFIQVFSLKNEEYNFQINSLDYFNKDTNNNINNYYNCPWFKQHNITINNQLMEKEVFVKILKKYILLKCYIVLEDKNKESLLIYGYDDESKYFMCGGYFGKDYELFTLNYTTLFKKYNINALRIIKIIDNVVINNNDLCLEKIITGIENFLYDTNHDNNIYGVKYYDELIKLLNCFDMCNDINVMNFYEKKEHTKLMIIRFKYLNYDRMNILIKEYEEFYKEFKIFLNNLIKLNYRKQIDLKNKLISRIENLKLKEINILEKAILLLKG